MEFKFTKEAGSDDFHQELIDCLNKNYQDLEVFIDDLLRNGKELHILRQLKEGCFSITVSVIDVNNEIITINWVGVGG